MSHISALFKGLIETFPLDVKFNVPARGVTALFGPSGCGKSSVLRCIAGLEQVKKGHLRMNEEIWQDENTFVPAHKRSVGYVFQEASLFPHLNVLKNLKYGLKRRAQARQEAVFDDVVSLLGLEKMLDRAPLRLSGGERQRVAIGRALLSSPSILLMDEPMAALDRRSKDEIIPYLERLRSQLDIPMIYVSHDMNEVQRLCDHMVFLEDGQVRAAGPLETLLTDSSLPLAGEREASVVLNARLLEYSTQDGLSVLDVSGAQLLVAGFVGGQGQSLRVRINASDVSLAVEVPSQTTILNVLGAVVLDINVVNETQVNVLCGLGDADGAQILARITKKSQSIFQFFVGQRVYAQIKGVSLIGR